MSRPTLAMAFAAVFLFMMASGASASCTLKGCQSCATKTRCRVCKVGWYKDPSSWRCLACPRGCSACKLWHGKVQCTKCTKHFVLTSGKCVRPSPHTCPKPHWDMHMFEWVDVYGRTDMGGCVKCTPTGNHKGWCKACDGDHPSICTHCHDPNHHHPMYIDHFGACQFCSQSHDGCLACHDHMGAVVCDSCDGSMGYHSDGSGGCDLHMH